MTTPNLDSIFARLKKPKEITPEMDRVGIWIFEKWQPRHGYFAWEDFAIAILDLMQRQDKENTELNEKYALLESRCFDGVPTGSSVWGELDASIAREKRLREGLELYAEHLDSCDDYPDIQDSRHTCTCGLDALLKEGR